MKTCKNDYCDTPDDAGAALSASVYPRETFETQRVPNWMPRVTVVLVPPGQRYGMRGHWCGEPQTNHGPDWYVEFYDTEYARPAFDEQNHEGAQGAGQFVSRYLAHTITRRLPDVALSLQGGVDRWTIDGPTLGPIVEWIRAQMAGPVTTAGCAEPDGYPSCGHSACRQHWIDTGAGFCVEPTATDRKVMDLDL